jgi:hypothetical protein
MKKINFRSRKAQLVILATLFVISGFLILYARHSNSVVATEGNLTERKIEAVKSSTKLSFKDEKSLPKTYTPGQKHQLSFVIENHEGKTVDYLYAVTINGTQVAAHSLTVKNKVDQVVEQSFELPSDQQMLKIEVKLPTQNQTISYSMDLAK